jgi:hypothetical protein
MVSTEPGAAQYFAYLERVKREFPPSLAAFAFDHGRYELNGDRTLHDAWLQSVTAKKVYGPNRTVSTSVELHLLHSSHERHITLRYGGVAALSYSLPSGKMPPRPCDLLVHEFTVSSGFFVHRILFDGGEWLEVSFLNFEVDEVTEEKLGKGASPK